jgi:NDP-sugar pyrophosphorylase family protein
MKAVLLVGGMGSRLRAVVSSTPKPLAPVGKRSFLELLIEQLRSQGIWQLVLCTGYLANHIEQQFGDGRKWGVEIQYSKELEPLGTAGAIRNAQAYLSGETFLVMNGDSFLEADFDQLADFHRKHRGIATIAATRVSNAGRYGTLHIDRDDRILRFSEKTGTDMPGVINGGIYLFEPGVLGYFPQGSASLEKVVFPKLLGAGVYALEQRGIFVDIGTPEDYAAAQQLCARLDQAVSLRTVPYNKASAEKP